MSFFDDLGSKKKTGKIVNLKLEPDTTYQLRLCCEPIEFTKLFVGNKSVVISKESKLPEEYGIPATTRVAAVVIDRADGAVKLVESPATPYKPLVAWRKLKKRDPAGENGCDLGIDVVGSGKEKRYTGVALDDSTLTPEEIKKIQDAGFDLEGKNLAKLYKVHTDEEAAARLFNKPVATKAPTATKPVTGTTQMPVSDEKVPF